MRVMDSAVFQLGLAYLRISKPGSCRHHVEALAFVSEFIKCHAKANTK